MKIVNSKQMAKSTPSAAEKIVDEMNALDLAIVRLTSCLEDNKKSQEELNIETEEILAQLESLKAEDSCSDHQEGLESTSEVEIPNSDWSEIQPIKFEDFKRLRESPIHSTSIEWTRSEYEDIEQEKPVEVSSSPAVNGFTIDQTDIFWDPRQLIFQADYRTPVDLLGDCPCTSAMLEDPGFSEVHEQVMDLLRLITWKKEEADKELCRRYLEKKTTDLEVLPVEEKFRIGFSEYEEWKNIVCLWGEELLYGMWEHLPDQSISPQTFPTTKQFVDTSREVLDPEIELLESSELKPWTENEKKILMEQFIEHPKDFYKIAQSLPHRSTGECVQFFYANKKLDEFGNVRRKQQLKKRRLQSESNKEAYSQLMTLGKVSPTFLTEQQKKKELQSWILSRIEKQQPEFSDQQLITAAEKFGLNYKAIAQELGCQQASFVGSYLLLHRRRLGLDNLFEQRANPHSQAWTRTDEFSTLRRATSERYPSTSSRQLQLDLEISRRASDQLPDKKDPSTGLPARMASYLVGEEQEDKMKAIWQKMPYYSYQQPPTKDANQQME